MAKDNRRQVLRSCENNSLLQRFLGGLAVGSFVTVWLSSLLSPLFFVVTIVYKMKLLLTILSFLIIIAYSPWKRGFIAKSVGGFFDHYHAFYYNSFKLIMHHDPYNARDNPKLFYAIHPHGAFCLGWSTLFCAFTQVKFCFSPALFMSPFFRIFSRLTGNPGTADKPSMIKYMKSNQDLALPPGGFEEATLTSLQHDRVYIKNRMGFVKLCLQYGYSIVPVYCFGENQTFWNIQGWWNFRIKVLNKWGIPAILVWGLPLLPLVPKYSASLFVVTGPPIELPKLSQPTREQVQEWHTKYIQALEQIYDDHKEEFYGKEIGKTKKLEIW